MRVMMMAVVLGAVVLASGCATKRYPIATPLSAAEARLMDCSDLELELVRAEQVEQQISQTAQVDWRSVAGFLGDYGIGNAMAKNEAEAAIRQRRATLREAQISKGCNGAAPPTAAAAAAN